MHWLRWVGWVVGFGFQILAVPSYAGTIGVDGSLAFNSPVAAGTLDWRGTRGFVASGYVFQGPFLALCAPCQPGDRLGVSFNTTTEDMLTMVRLEGQRYQVGGQVVSGQEPQLRFSVTGPDLIAPPLNVAPMVALIAPVTVSGTFTHLGVTELLNTMATVNLVLSRQNGGEGGPWWFETSTTYSFSHHDHVPLSPSPEPGTLLLLGSSLSVVGWLARKRVGLRV